MRKNPVNPLTVSHVAQGGQQTTLAPTYKHVYNFFKKIWLCHIVIVIWNSLDNHRQIRVMSACQGAANSVVIILWKTSMFETIWDE